MATVTQLAKYNQGERAVLKLWKPGYLAAKTTSERKTAFAVAAAELFNYWITQMKTDVEKKKGFSPEEKKQREGVNVMELLVWVRNNWWAKRHCKKVTEDGGQLLHIGYQTVLPRMDAYKECIEEYANQYLEAAVLSELEKAKSAYVEGRSLTENIGEMAQEEEPDWVDVETRIWTVATKCQSPILTPLGVPPTPLSDTRTFGIPRALPSRLMHDSCLRCGLLHGARLSPCSLRNRDTAGLGGRSIKAEAESHTLLSYAMLGALKALDANCHDMFKRFGMLTYSIAVFLDPERNPKFTSADAGQLIFKDNLIKDKRLEDQVWYHFTQQVVVLNKKRFGKADDSTAVDNDIPVDALDSQIQLSKNADGTPILPSCFVSNVPVHSKIVKQTLRLFLNAHYLLSQHCEEAAAADYLLTAPMFKFGQPHNMVAELANEWYDILLAKQEIEQPFKFRVYYNTKEKQMMSESSPAQPLTGDWSVHVTSEASDMLPNVPPPGRARLSFNTSRHVIMSDNGTHLRSPAPSILMQSESPPPTPASPPRKIKKGGKTNPGKKRLKGTRADVSASLASEPIAIRPKPCRLQRPATEETNDPELQYPTHTNTLTTQLSATARKRVTEEERLARDAERYQAAEGSKRQSKKSSHALNQ
ncbi:hypothetical protein BDN71DRAFT_1563463 [Pleurotus eryngii]|uniref:Uncharacterized protein n=1 Tax=Pleurotus eryngii TaxID=5323 RepID=A0A9P5ZWX6_PLEER|nr:hypothetical protein BDN71DRAFT_1563463 [Pleurotus eryngii]